MSNRTQSESLVQTVADGLRQTKLYTVRTMDYVKNAEIPGKNICMLIDANDRSALLIVGEILQHIPQGPFPLANKDVILCHDVEGKAIHVCLSVIKPST